MLGHGNQQFHCYSGRVAYSQDRGNRPLQSPVSCLPNSTASRTKQRFVLFYWPCPSDLDDIPCNTLINSERLSLACFVKWTLFCGSTFIYQTWQSCTRTYWLCFVSCCTLKYLNITNVHLAADSEAHKIFPVPINVYINIHSCLNTYTYLSIYNTCMLVYVSTYILTYIHTYTTPYSKCD
jgi:hypothetical protein